MEEIKFCKCCHTPNTRPRIRFFDGVCNGCINAQNKVETNWTEKLEELKALCAPDGRHKAAEYDVVIPVSGGKDSHYQAYFAKEELGLKPLVVSFSSLMPTPIGKDNLANLRDAVGVDHISINPNPDAYMRLSKFSLETFGDPYKPFLSGVFNACARVAMERNVRLFLYGENGEAEYGGSDAPEFNNLGQVGVNARIASDSAVLPMERWNEYGFSKGDLSIFLCPEKLDDNVKRIFLADYIPWNNNRNLYYAMNVIGGFKTQDERTVGSYTHGSGLDDYLDEIYLWLLWPKFGYGRTTKYVAKDVREGKLSTEKSLELIKLYDGEFPWHMFDNFLRTFNMTEEDFWAIVERHIGTTENIEAYKKKYGSDNFNRPVSWEKIGSRTYRHLGTQHGEERILEFPLRRS